ncbi:MAG: hypothetical protein WC815_23955 [Vicinamibacterales bacterium]|jgi:hypothetical protein
MISSIVVKEWGATPGLLKSQVNRLIKESLAATAEFHFRFMHFHFEMIAFNRYGYKPRKGMGKSGKEFYQAYTGRKLKKTGQVNPLVYSGESRRLALAEPPRVTSTRHRATLVQRARGLNRRNPKSDIRMNEEIKAIAPSEARGDLRFTQHDFVRRCRELRASKITRV